VACRGCDSFSEQRGAGVDYCGGELKRMGDGFVESVVAGVGGGTHLLLLGLPLGAPAETVVKQTKELPPPNDLLVQRSNAVSESFVG
jgi:hypothetical protein